MSRPDAATLTPAGETAGLDPIEALGALDDTTRANLIGTIVGHPKGAPSKKELEYYNPSVAASTLTGHLDRLEEVGLIEVIEREREGLERSFRGPVWGTLLGTRRTRRGSEERVS